MKEELSVEFSFEDRIVMCTGAGSGNCSLESGNGHQSDRCFLMHEMRAPHEEKRWGLHVNVSSIGGVQGAPAVGPCIDGKHGMIGLTRTAALENVASRLRVNAMLPGFTLTPLVESALAQDGVTADSLPPMASPEDTAEALVWLLSDRASFVNGSSIVVDGGTMSLVYPGSDWCAQSGGADMTHGAW